MNFPLFALYTTLGAALWSAVLVGVGYWVGANEDLLGARCSREPLCGCSGGLGF